MITQIIAISDVHVSSDNENAILERFESLLSIVASRELYISKLIVLCVGDLAQSGKREEYNSFVAAWECFVEECKKKISGLEVSIYCVPGNHDVDYTKSKVCDVLIRNCSVEDYGEYEEEFDSRQEAFYEALSHLNPQLSKNKDVLQQHVVDVGHPWYKINLVLYNSSRYIRKGQERGTYNVLDAGEKCRKPIFPALTITMIHHPLDHFEQKGRQKLERMIESESHILLTGHDHFAKAFDCETSVTKLQKIEMPAFFESSQMDECGAVSLYIKWPENDGDVVIENVLYSWDENKEFTCCENRTIYIENSEVINNVNFSEEQVEWLTKSYPPFDCNGLSVSGCDDFYVFPYLKKKEHNSSVCIDSKKLIYDRGVDNLKIIISGDSASGKTMLAKQYVWMLSRKGLKPLYVDCSSVKGNSIVEVIDKAYRKQYNVNSASEYLSVESQKTVVVFDNLHDLKIQRKNISSILVELGERIPRIVAFTNDQLFMAQSSDPTMCNIIEEEYDCYDIMPFNHLLCLRLLNKWVDYTYPHITEQERDYKISESEKLMESLIGRSIVPKYPFYIGLMLQAISLSHDSVSQKQVGTCGGLYDVVMKLQLSRISAKVSGLDTCVNYLSRMAFQLYRRGETSFSKQEYEQQHREYEKMFGVSLNLTQLLDSLCNIGVLCKDVLTNNAVRIKFRLPYTYYYFVASYLQRNIEHDAVKTEIQLILEHVYKKEMSYIWLFLTHLLTNRFIIDTLLNSIKSLLSDYKQIDFAEDIKSLWGDMEMELKLEFKDKSYQQLSEERARAADAVEASYSEPQIQDGNLPEAKLYSAMKIVEISGQLLRNFVGSIELNAKKDILVECYSLSLRAISFFLQELKRSVSDYVVNKLGCDTEEASDCNQLYERTIKRAYPIVQMYAYGVLHAMAMAVAHKELSPAYDAAKKSMPANGATDFLNVIVRLFGLDESEELINFATSPKRNGAFFVKQMAKMAGFVYCYMTPISGAQKQRICHKLGIDYIAMQLLERRMR